METHKKKYGYNFELGIVNANIHTHTQILIGFVELCTSSFQLVCHVCIIKTKFACCLIDDRIF